MKAIRIGIIALVSFVWACLPGAVWGHAIYVFASGEGNVIKGKVYLRGGEGIPDVDVRAITPDGKAVTQTRTDAAGQFQLTVPFRCDYVIEATLADGHQATWKVAAEELSRDLPAPGLSGQEVPPEHTQPQPEQKQHDTAEEASLREGHMAPATAPGHEPDTAQLTAELAGLRSQVVQLRQEWQEFQSRSQLRDILGGVGYILGITGLIFYFLGKKRPAGVGGKQAGLITKSDGLADQKKNPI